MPPPHILLCLARAPLHCEIFLLFLSAWGQEWSRTLEYRIYFSVSSKDVSHPFCTFSCGTGLCAFLKGVGSCSIFTALAYNSRPWIFFMAICVAWIWLTLPGQVACKISLRLRRLVTSDTNVVFLSKFTEPWAWTKLTCYMNQTRTRDTVWLLQHME